MVYGNPFAPILPMEIWLLIRKFKVELEMSEKLDRIERIDKLLKHHRFMWKSPYSTARARRTSKRMYKLWEKERDDVING